MEKEKGYLKSERLPSSRRVLGEFAGNLLQVSARERRCLIKRLPEKCMATQEALIVHIGNKYLLYRYSAHAVLATLYQLAPQPMT